MATSSLTARYVTVRIDRQRGARHRGPQQASSRGFHENDHETAHVAPSCSRRLRRGRVHLPDRRRSVFDRTQWEYRPRTGAGAKDWRDSLPNVAGRFCRDGGARVGLRVRSSLAAESICLDVLRLDRCRRDARRPGGHATSGNSGDWDPVGKRAGGNAARGDRRSHRAPRLRPSGTRDIPRFNRASDRRTCSSGTARVSRRGSNVVAGSLLVVGLHDCGHRFFRNRRYVSRQGRYAGESHINHDYQCGPQRRSHRISPGDTIAAALGEFFEALAPAGS